MVLDAPASSYLALLRLGLLTTALLLLLLTAALSGTRVLVGSVLLGLDDVSALHTSLLTRA